MSDKEKSSVISSSILSKIPVEISVVLGKSNITLQSLQKKAKGDFIPLEYGSSDSVSIFANNKLIAKGEVIVSNNQLGVTIKELIN